MKEKHILKDLVVTFFKIGLVTFGGGYAMISLVEDECVGKQHRIAHFIMSYPVFLTYAFIFY